MARRPEVTHSRRPVRAPRIEAPTAYRAVSSAIARQAEPTSATSAGLLFRELGRALGHERVALADEGAPLQLPRDDHLSTFRERVRHGTRVTDWHRLGAVPIADAEAELVPRPADRPVDHL